MTLILVDLLLIYSFSKFLHSPNVDITGSILSSKSLTVRWFMSCWWLGCVILGATYSANLVAFLSTERYGPLYSTAEELAEQNQLKLGVVGRTALDDFFMVTMVTHYI